MPPDFGSMLPLATLTSKNCGPLARLSRPSSSQTFRLSGASQPPTLTAPSAQLHESRVSTCSCSSHSPSRSLNLQTSLLLIHRVHSPSSHHCGCYDLHQSLATPLHCPFNPPRNHLTTPPATYRQFLSVDRRVRLSWASIPLPLSSPPSAATCPSTPLLSSPRHESRAQLTICLRHLKEACASHCIRTTYLETSQSPSYQTSSETVHPASELMSR